MNEEAAGTRRQHFLMWAKSVEDGRTARRLLGLRLESLRERRPEERARLVVEDLRRREVVRTCSSSCSDEERGRRLTVMASSRKLVWVVWSFLSRRTFSSV